MKKRNISEEIARIEERLEEEVAAAQDALADAEITLHDYIATHPAPWSFENDEYYDDFAEEVEDAKVRLAAAEDELQVFYADPEAYLDEEEDDGLRISDFI